MAGVQWGRAAAGAAPLARRRAGPFNWEFAMIRIDWAARAEEAAARAEEAAARAEAARARGDEAAKAAEAARAAARDARARAEAVPAE